MENLQWVPPGHFYSPIPDFDILDDLIKDRHRNIEYPSAIEFNISDQLELLIKLSEYYSDLPWEESPNDNLLYNYDNPNFSYSDAITYYSMIRYTNPDTIIEIGCGYSSALSLDVNRLFFNNKIEIKFIEPYPELLLRILKKKKTKYTLYNQKLQDISLNFFMNLKSNDILFIDSTHVSKYCSDVNYIIHDILPVLPSGIYIHFHDIFYPFEYPEEWLREKRAWNEQYILRAFLEYNQVFKIVFFNNFLAQKFPENFYSIFPMARKCPGGGIWLKKI